MELGRSGSSGKSLTRNDTVTGL
ncbi:hypothetical protein CCACVL1_12354 [Corchorus capsularis]|uniref:Uncharacterized protein n=1 Tax=Corchorus capsularis TaxID=210143 RepID=A0A1R3IG53_COCAP|nr:hypothetical protein CCACVL1_12354 [Corchorus capsularis]